MPDRRLLATYLNDHLAGSTIGLELAKRARGSNEGNEYGKVLDRVASEIAEDREALQRLMESLEIGPDRPKLLAAWTAEKLGRLKPNGRLLRYSPLSRLIELEALTLGVNGKLSLWRTLAGLAESDPRFDRERLGRLIERAEAQRALLEDLRGRAASEAFAG